MLLGARSCTGRGGACTGALGGREAAPGASHPRTGQLVPPGGSRGSDPGCPSLTPCANAGFSRAGPKTVKSPARSRSPRAEADGARPATARSWTHKHPAPALQVGARLRFPLTARRVRVAWGRRAGDSKLDSRNDRDLFFFSFSECDKPRTQHDDRHAAQWAGAAGARGGGACLPRARWLCRRACRPAPCTRGAGRERAAGRCGAGGPAPAAGRGLGRAPRTARLRCRHERRCAPDRPCTSCRWAHGALAPADSPGEGERAGE